MWGIILGGPIQAQPNSTSLLKQSYEALQFEKTIALGQQLLRQQQTFTPQTLIEIHKYMGFAYFNLGKLDSASVQFLTILELDPQYEFDPITTSPKIISFYHALKKQFLSRQIQPQPSVVRYVFVPDKRPAASWRSLLVPGWGQYYKGQKQRAKIYFSAFVVGVSTTLTAALLEKNYHNTYKNVNDPADLAAAYDDYNRWFKIRKVATFLTVGIWVASVFDAMWVPYSQSVKNVYLKTEKNGITVGGAFNF